MEEKDWMDKVIDGFWVVSVFLVRICVFILMVKYLIQWNEVLSFTFAVVFVLSWFLPTRVED